MHNRLLLTLALSVAATFAYASDDLSGKYDVALQAQHIAKASELGIDSTKTVYIPARYSMSSQGSLYLNGVRWFAPGGAGEVEAFINTTTGYLIAVRQSGVSTVLSEDSQPAPSGMVIDPKMFEGMSPEQKIKALEMLQQISGGVAARGRVQRVAVAPNANNGGSQIVFYKVSVDGQVISTIGTLPYGKTQLAVTPDSIYVPQPAVGPARSTVFNYVGYNASGTQVSGPQGVMFATPLPDGGWFTQEIVTADNDHSIIGSGIQSALVTTDKSGARKEMKQTFSAYRGYNGFASTTAIAVDSPTLSDSYRTGYTIRMFREADSWNASTDFSRVAGAAFSLSNPAPTRTQIDCFGLCNHDVSLLGDFTLNYGDVHSGAFNNMQFISQRLVLLGTPKAPIMVTQLSAKDFKKESYPDASGLYLGYVNLDGKMSEAIPMYNLIGGGLNLARKIMGSNTTDISTNKKNDVFGVVTPKAQFILFVDKLQKGTFPGYVPETGSVISDDDARTFASKFGLALQ